ncbi:MAG: hypothetical protein WCJ56_14710, partial [bacterium]
IPQVHAPALASSMISSIYGAVHTWDDSITVTDLFGYSGHAFILNIERAMCASGPTGWDWGAILFPLRQLYSLKRLCANCDMRDVDEARELIWERTQVSIDAGRPVVLWDALLPEFYLAYGYDDENGTFNIQGPAAERVAGQVSYLQLGQHTGQVWAIFPSPREDADRDAARDLALRGAVSWHHWENERDAQWVFGGEAWDVWIEAMREEELAVEPAAAALNHHVYAECRRQAAEFLKWQGEQFATAAACYDTVASNLEAIVKGWPMNAAQPTHNERISYAELLVIARDAEDAGVAALDEALLVKK